MFDRGLLKNQAKEFLRNHFWQAFVVCLIVALLTGGSNVNYKYDKDGISDNSLLDN